MDKIERGNPLTQSADIVKENLETLKRLFPTIVKEGKIDVDELKALIDDEVETSEEYYRFTWAGKSEARREANKPSTGTLRPNKADSKDWDTTGNIFIEGDNLEVLKLLQKSYAGKIKIMYFDPPYNTGNDFVYKDNYTDNLGNYLDMSKQIDDDGNKLNTNTESDGRYHSNWLNMMYPRLKLAHNLLSDDGVVFISIGQNEIHNIVKLCDEIFGESNKIGIVSRLMKSGGNKGTFFSSNIDYVVIYSKNVNLTKGFRCEMSEELVKKVYNQIEKEGTRKGEFFRSMGLYQSSLDPMRGCTNQRYFIEAPDGSLVIPKGNCFPKLNVEGDKIAPESGQDGVWRWTYPKYQLEKMNGNIEFKETTNYVLVDEKGNPSKWNVYTKIWLKDRQEDGQLPVDLITKYENRHSAKELAQLNISFDFAKPVGLIKYLLLLTQQNNTIVLDFFSGSATTAHAVMQLNAEDGGCRKFIMVQLPEPIDEKSEAYKAGFANIAELSKERIRRAGEKVKSELSTDLFSGNKNKLDIGFKAFKLDSSNIHSWDGSVENFEANLFNAQNNIKDDRTEEDVLFEILLKYGLDLTVPIQEKAVGKCKLYSIGSGVLFICLSDNITTEVAKSIGEWKNELEPATCRVLFKDNGFIDDVAKTNSVQILRQYGIEECNSI